MTCRGCGTELPPKRGPGPRRKWCSDSCRKRTLYSGTCEWCGARTNGSNGRGSAAVICATCLHWTPEAIIDAMQRWAADHDGAPPIGKAWQNAGPGHPSKTCVLTHFGKWNDALLAAGLELNMDRRPETQEWIEQQLREGRPVTEIADALGVTRGAIYDRCKSVGGVSALRGARR